MAKVKSKLVMACDRVWNAYRKLGSLAINDGSLEGDEFEESILAMRTTYRKHTHQTSRERAELVNIVNALNQFSEPIHFKIREAIESGRRALDESDLIVED